jgi:hypothetical protein
MDNPLRSAPPLRLYKTRAVHSRDRSMLMPTPLPHAARPSAPHFVRESGGRWTVPSLLTILPGLPRIGGEK